METPSVFDETDIWAWVYGVPTGLGFLLILFGSNLARGFGTFLILGVIGSFLTISAIESFHNWLDGHHDPS